MQLNPGSRLGPYEIVSLIGAGGMGEVYHGRDTRLDRDVAIKILPQTLSANPALRQRFEREARAISSLSHPNVCTLHDIGQQDGIDYLVMEYLEGETLATRLGSGPLPLEQVLRRGIEIAEALDKAHRHGIVHRDLKPGNIMLTKSGAKLLDFGLAKIAQQSDASNAGVTNLPTEQKALTAEGTILGTFQYMAPEQLEGAEADARTDIFALGSVLYEMATGKRAFEGKTKTSLIAAIVDRDPPPISSLQPMTPPAFERLVKTCLAKDPDERWQSAHDVASELRWIAEAGSQAGVSTQIASRRKKREGLWMGIAAAFAIVAALLAIPFVRARLARPEPMYSSIVPPEPLAFMQNEAGALSISPNGRYLTFAAMTGERPSLWVRDLTKPAARRLEGTEWGSYPFWSPDSRWIAYFADGKLRKADVAGGPAITIADAPNARGGSWSRDDVILFAPHWRDPLFKVSANGGKPEPLTKLDERKVETTHRYPWFLPDGKRFLYLSASHKSENDSDLNAIYAASLDSPADRKLILSARSNVIYTSGHLFFIRDKYLMAQPFDVDALELRGAAVRVAEDVSYSSGFFRGIFAVSNHGVLAYNTGRAEPRRRVVKFDRQGKEIGPIGDVAESLENIRFSPDGARLAAAIGDPPDLWIVDVKRGTRSRFTSERMSEDAAVWSPDATSIVFQHDPTVDADALYEKSTDGMSRERPLLVEKGKSLWPTDWSTDGSFLVFAQSDKKSNSNSDVWILPMKGERKPFPFAATDFDEWGGVFSPDGRWLLFASNESGRAELFVAPFPGPGAKRQLTTTGCAWGMWRRDGKEVIAATEDGQQLLSIEVNGGHFGDPTVLSTFPVARAGDVSPDGQTIALVIPEPLPANASITLLKNWQAALAGSQ